MEFHARDVLEAGREQVNGHVPGAVAKFGTLHQSAGLGRDVAALAAAVRLGLARGARLDVGGAASRAIGAVGPEDVLEPADRGLRSSQSQVTPPLTRAVTKH